MTILGFDMNYASGGLWGRGLYFAAKSSYAHRYHRKLSENTYSIICCLCLNWPFYRITPE